MYARMGRCVPNARLAFHEIKAWGHFAYNVGETAFCNSTAAKLLNRGENEAACKQLPRWRSIKGQACAIRGNTGSGIVGSTQRGDTPDAGARGVGREGDDKG